MIKTIEHEKVKKAPGLTGTLVCQAETAWFSNTAIVFCTVIHL